ncbi:hypothetical protein BgiBS90_032427 [Biomphalaria glabrata]|nr:hypothetical protein BgiBS90_032427 [Biomphalaria glabrata]
MRNVCRFCQIIASVYNLNDWSLVFDELLGKKTILSASQRNVDQCCKNRINHVQAAITNGYESETQRKCIEYPNSSFKSSSLLRKLSHQLSQTIERDNSNTLVKRSEAIESSSTNVAKVPPVTKSYGEEDPSQKTVENSSLSSSAVVEFNSCTGAVNLDYTDVPELVSLNSSIVRDFYVDL